MKTIGLLGGTGWSSTLDYYKFLNEKVHQRLGGYHSANILLKSIDYHDIMSSYGKDHARIAQLLQQELEELIKLEPDCILICCNSLHKYYEMIKHKLRTTIPLIHAIELVAKKSKEKGYKHILLLATKFTMEDGFFEKILEDQGLKVTIPNTQERQEIADIHEDLMKNYMTNSQKNYFKSLIEKYKDLDAVVLGCTEYPLVINDDISILPILNPVHLQCEAAVEYSLGSYVI
ncbi:MAG: amino acid racemase [Proteobacteria bacterium]|nr:amino acid racemase [Pseudomonadota bacterium]